MLAVVDSKIMKRMFRAYFKNVQHECWKLIDRKYFVPKDKDELATDLLRNSLNVLENTKVKILEAGCGNTSRVYVQDKRITYIGIDLVFEDVKRNSRMNNGLISDLSKIPLKNRSIDVIVSNVVFEHIKNPENVFMEFSRILKTKGYLIFVTPSIYGIVTIINRLFPDELSKKLSNVLVGTEESDVFPTVYKANSMRKLRKLLYRHKFIEIDAIMHQPPPYAFVFSKCVCRLIIYYYKILNNYDFLKSLRGIIIARYQKT